MATINTKEGQSIFDLTIQHYGSIEDLFNIVSQFTDINFTVPTNTALTIEENNNNIVTYYKTNNTDVATVDALDGEPVAIGFDYGLDFGLH
jgi:hypothetical protein